MNSKKILFSFDLKILKNPWLYCYLAIGVLRLYYCFCVPLDTTDLMRNMGFGLEFWQYGLGVYDLSTEDFAPAPYHVLWSVHNYTYPAITLLFFALLSAIWPAIVWGKIVMTLLALANSGLVWRITQNRLLAFLYWAHPIGIWFGSREGQFEEMVAFWILLSILFLRRNRPVSFLFLAFAIQSKLFPVFLIPYFVWKTIHLNSGADLSAQQWGSIRETVLSFTQPVYIHCFLWFCAGFLPSFLCISVSHYLLPEFKPGFVPELNAIPWAVLKYSLFPLQPFGIMFLHTLTGLVFVILCFFFTWKTKNPFPFLGALVFVFFVKNNVIAMPWYMHLTSSFCLTVENERHRNILFLLSLTFGFGSLVRMVDPHFQYNNLPEILILLEKNLYFIVH